MVIFHSHVSSPEGIHWFWKRYKTMKAPFFCFGCWVLSLSYKLGLSEKRVLPNSKSSSSGFFAHENSYLGISENQCISVIWGISENQCISDIQIQFISILRMKTLIWGISWHTENWILNFLILNPIFSVSFFTFPTVILRCVSQCVRMWPAHMDSGQTPTTPWSLCDSHQFSHRCDGQILH